MYIYIFDKSTLVIVLHVVIRTRGILYIVKYLGYLGDLMPKLLLNILYIMYSHGGFKLIVLKHLCF